MDYKNGILRTLEDNIMALSCRGDIIISDGLIKEVHISGYPRALGMDAWIVFYEEAKKNDKISEDQIKHLLTFDGKHNVVSIFEEG